MVLGDKDLTLDGCGGGSLALERAVWACNSLERETDYNADVCSSIIMSMFWYLYS